MVRNFRRARVRVFFLEGKKEIVNKDKKDLPSGRMGGVWG